MIFDRLCQQFADSPARLAWIQKHSADEAVLSDLLKEVDDSPYDVGQWVDAFIVIEDWLLTHVREASLADQLGYIHCTCEVAGSGANLTTLAAMVSEMLHNYGFDRSVKKADPEGQSQ